MNLFVLEIIIDASDKPKALKCDSIYNIDMLSEKKRVSGIYLHLL